MISKTKIKKKARRKTNPELVETIRKLEKNSSWLKIANMISGPTRKLAKINLSRIEKETKEGDSVLIPGKVLGSGEISKKIRVIALSFSEEAREKLKAKKCEIVKIIEEFKVNSKFQGLKILK